MEKINALFNPKSIAIIGASERVDSIGFLVLRNIILGGYTGEIYLVNPKYNELEGLPCLRSVNGLPKDGIDLALICTPEHTHNSILTALSKKHCRFSFVLGTRQRDTETKIRSKRGKRRGTSVIGPNSLGIISPHIKLNASFAHTSAEPGRIAMVSQSHTVVTSVLDWAKSEHVGFSHCVSMGDMWDVAWEDVLDYLATDYRTHTVVLYLEYIANARTFLSAVRAVAKTKPVIVLTPRYSMAARQSESAPTLSRYDIYATAFRRVGIMPVDSIESLFNAIEAFPLMGPQAEKSISVLVNDYAIGQVTAASVEHHGLNLTLYDVNTLIKLNEYVEGRIDPDEPINLGITGTVENYINVIRTLLKGTRHTNVLVAHSPSPMIDSQILATELVKNFKSNRKRLITCWLGPNESKKAQQIMTSAGFVAFDTPEHALDSYRQMLDYHTSQVMLTETPPSQSSEVKANRAHCANMIKTSLRHKHYQLSIDESYQLLYGYGFELADHFGDLTRYQPEVIGIIGFETHRVFGPILYLKPAVNKHHRLFRRSLGLPPLNIKLASEMLLEAGLYKRAGSEGNLNHSLLKKASEVLLKLSQLAVDQPDIHEIEIRMIVTEEELQVATSDIRVTKSKLKGYERLAIHPYPVELEEPLCINKDNCFLMRPIRPEDEHKVHAALKTLSDEDIRRRFFYAMKHFDHSFLAKLTQIDYEREMAFVLTDADDVADPFIYGVARISQLSTDNSAEFAVFITPKIRGLGMGKLLMNRLIEYAKAKNYSVLEGHVLSDNTPMLALCRATGFHLEHLKDEPGVMMVKMPLGQKEK